MPPKKIPSVSTSAVMLMGGPMGQNELMNSLNKLKPPSR